MINKKNIIVTVLIIFISIKLILNCISRYDEISKDQKLLISKTEIIKNYEQRKMVLEKELNKEYIDLHSFLKFNSLDSFLKEIYSLEDKNIYLKSYKLLSDDKNIQSENIFKDKELELIFGFENIYLIKHINELEYKYSGLSIIGYDLSKKNFQWELILKMNYREFSISYEQ